MRCIEIINYLPDHVLEELPPELQILVNEHLAVCEKCHTEAMRVEETVADFKNSIRFRPSTDVYKKIRGQLRIPKSRSTRLLGFPKGLVYAFGAFLLGVILTKSIDRFTTRPTGPLRIESRQEPSRKTPYSDTVEFYAVPAKTLVRI